MFKLESYITPIILNHVAKYVKNIRPTDAQVSLWEGEVAFQNLDLRLDVLEEELNLPFEFLSGHIHELTIHVPWTKITSEPINITINTIEFVLKLKDHTTKLFSENLSENKSTTSLQEQQPQGSGYMPGLVQKIINNISITCHNIILKYIEEDIVVSMNVQLLSVNSANDLWQSAFIDIIPGKTLLRKLIQISDLTICLDKRNSEGQIEVCQEPILYRCSLELRIIHSILKPSIIRIGIFTKSMEINISSLQFPMAMRLIALVMALKTGDLKKPENNASLDNNTNKDNINKNQSNTNNNESYLSWIWNSLPTFPFDDNELDNDDDNNKNNNDSQLVGNYLNIGIYITNLQLILKSSEFINDTIIGTTKKIKYNSIVKITLGGIFSETLIANDFNWFDTKAGISKIIIEPLGNYVNNDTTMNLFLTSNTELNQSYLSDSLFDIRNLHLQNDINFIINPIKYLEHNTEDYLTYRGSCIVFDIVQYKEYNTNQNLDDSILNVMLNNNQLDKTITRIYLSSIRLKYNLTLLKTIDTIKELLLTYDYPPYATDITSIGTDKSKISFDEYNQDIYLDDRPVKIFQLTLQNIIIEIYPEAYLLNKKQINKNYKIYKQQIMDIKNKLPYFIITIDNAHCKAILPTETDKIIKYLKLNTTKSNRLKELIHYIYKSIKIEFKNIKISLCDVGFSYNILLIPKGNINISQLLDDIIITNDDIYLLNVQSKIDTLHIRCNRPQILLIIMLLDVFINNSYESAINLYTATSRVDIHNTDLNYIETVFSDILLNYQEYINIYRFNGYIKSIQCNLLSNATNITDLLIFQTAEHLINVKRKKFLLWTIQLPKNIDNIKYTPTVSIEFESFYLIISSDFIEFLRYSNIVIQKGQSIDRESKESFIYLKKVNQLSIGDRSSRKISNPQETVHLSSEKEYFTIDEDDTIIEPTEKSSSKKEYLNVIKLMLVSIKINQAIFCILDKSERIQVISQILKINNINHTKIMIPKIDLRSSITNKFVTSNTFEPINNAQSLVQAFPWNCTLSDFHIINESIIIGKFIVLHSFNINITFDLANKKDATGINKFLQNESADRIKKKFESKQSISNLKHEKKFDKTSVTAEEVIEENPIKINSEKLHDELPDNEVLELNNENFNIRKKSFDINKPTNGAKVKIKPNNIIEITINLHIDTSPIKIDITPPQSYCTFIRLHYLLQTFSLLKYRSEFLHNNFRIITSSENDPLIKEFLEFDTNSELSDENLNKNVTNDTISIWLQWTITKIGINIINPDITHSKMTIELEDLIISLSQQIDYTKISYKIGTFNLRYYQFNKNNDWILNDNLKIKMLSDNSQSIFLNMVMTIAESGSIFKKIGGARTKSGDLNTKIVEIILSLKAMEIIFDVEQFIEFITIFLNISIKSEQETDEIKNVRPIIGSDLPLTYIDCKGLTIYLPVKTKFDWCNVAILKIKEIQITSLVENPYNRVPIRADVYNKAAQLGILNLPGSIVEDRQYDIRIKDVSVATGSWTEILNYMKEQNLYSRTTNPAFEWNNKTSNPTTLDIQYIFNNFVLSITYAPCVAYNNILICGQAIEFNSLTDLVTIITTDQLIMFSCMINNWNESSQCLFAYKETLGTVSRHSIISQRSFSIDRHFDALEQLIEINQLDSFRDNENKIVLDESLADSCLSTYDKIRRRTIFIQKATDEKIIKTIKRQIPYDISFLAGIFFIKLYISNRKLLHKKSNNSDTSIKLLKPLISVSLNQPCMLFSQRIYEYSLQLSLFNCNIHLPDLYKSSNSNKEFPVKFFDTKRGKLNVSGIPPSLLAVRVQYKKCKKSQLDCVIAKPCQFYISHKTIEHFVNVWIEVSKSTIINVCLQNNHQEIKRQSKIEMLRTAIFNAERFYLNLVQLNINLHEKDYEIKNILDDFRIGLNFIEHPEKMNLLCSFASFYMQSNSKILLHPVTLHISLDLQQEDWYKMPLISIKINFNVIHADLSVNTITNIVNLKRSFHKTIEIINQQLDDFNEVIKKNKQYNEVDKTNLSFMLLPQASSKRNSRVKEEFYRDDLRAGAFQFIDMNDEKHLPLPYQIFIILNNNGIICWRYPKPRKICKLHIYPIPMPNNIGNIKCQMEYYSQPHETFLYYCDFMLSETEENEIDLPERTVTSTIWRVIIIQPVVQVDSECFETSEEEEDLKSTEKIDNIYTNIKKEALLNQLHPKALVGCMRIDSLFNPDLVSKIQILIHIDQIQLNCLTEQKKYPINLPQPLQKFTIANQSSTNESFLTLKIDNIKIHSNVLKYNNYTLDTDFTFYILCLNYSFYNCEYLLEETNLKSNITIRNNNVDFNFILDKIRLNFGPDIMHTLMVSKCLWENQINMNNNRSICFILSRFIIANRLDHKITFGQENTKELLNLSNHQCTMYTFFSDMNEQKLVFYINDDKTDSISVYNRNSIKYLKCGNNVLIIKTKKQSTTQTFVYIKGQIEVISMIDEEFKIEFRHKNEHDRYATIPNQEYNLGINAKASFYLNVNQKSNITFRLRLISIFNTPHKGWTGDIPLKSNKNFPWLVKVPSSVNDDFISIWVRLHFEEIPDIIIDDQKPQRVLITIWPIFMIRSMFPRELTISENTTDILESLKGRGDEYQFKIAATHETDHEILFIESFGNEEHTEKKELSLKSLNWNKFFYYDTSLWTIDNILTDMGKSNKILWPVNDEIELQINRKTIITHNDTTPIYKYYPNSNTSCTLLLEISPWCMIINSLGYKISIFSNEKKLSINPNYISTIFLIDISFKLEIIANSLSFISLPIYFDQNECKNLLDKSYCILNDNDEIVLTLQNMSNLITKIIMQCINENGRKIIIIKPSFVIANNTNENFEIIPFCINDKELIIREHIQNSRLDNIIYLPRNLDGTNSKGYSIEFFNYIQFSQGDKKSFTNLLYFICLKPLNNFDITVPISMDTIFNRKCITYQKDEISIPLCANLLEKNGQYYLNIFIDLCPTLLINNETNLNFFIAQTINDNCDNNSTNGDESVLNYRIITECPKNNFEWYQILRSNSQLYYTPPDIYLNYPDIIKSYDCKISLAVLNEKNNSLFSNNTIEWSKPIKYDKSYAKFIFIPLYGDIKVIVCDKHKCTKISIFYVAEHLEFSVKDLRSRLNSPKEELIQLGIKKSELENKKDHKLIDTRKSNLCNHCNDSLASENELKIKVTIFVKQLTFCLFKEVEKKSFLKNEICSLYMDDIKLSLNTEKHFAKLIITNLQCDNNLYSNGQFDFPVVLCAENVYEHNNYIPSIYNINDDFAENFPDNSIIKIKIDFYDDTLDILSINCEINPIHAYIEDTYLNTLVDYLTDLYPNNVIYHQKKSNERETLQDGQILLPMDIQNKAKCLSDAFKLKSIRIAPMYVMLSVHTCVHLYIALDHSPLEFSSYEQQNILTQPMQFGYTIGWHYISGAFFGAGWVVGSLEILGSPSGLARSFSIGVRDFLSMPCQGLLSGPWGFILGVTNGSASLLRNITAGTINSVTKLAASVARNIDRITFDDEHFKRTEALRRQRPQSISEGFSQGLTGFGISMLGAVGGISRHTLEARTSVDIITGLGKGIVGAITKPISGAAELVALTGQGVLHTVGFNTMPIQRAITIIRNTALHPADGKLWKLLPEILLTDDQILFYNEATLIIDYQNHHQLKPVVICLTSTILAILELDKTELSYILPIEKVEANFEKDDNTLIHINSLNTKHEDLISEYLTVKYKNQRIMSFLQTSETNQTESDHRISWESLEDMINADILDKKIRWSFYISEPLGKHLLQYIKTIQINREEN